MKQLLKAVVIAIALVLVIKVFAFTSCTIPSTGMENTLYRGERVIVNLWSYGFRVPFMSVFGYQRWNERPVKRGDIVLFNNPAPADKQKGHSGKEVFINRCIGLPGDTLMCRFTLTDMFNPMYQNIFSTPARMDHSRFMGRAAEYNMYYWNKVKPMMPTIDTMYLLEKRCVERGAADEFKASIDRRLQMVKDSLRTLASRYAVSDRTMDLLYAEYTQREYVRKYFYVYPVEDTRFIPLIPSGEFLGENPNYIPLPGDYFNFYSMDWMDDPLMVTGSVFEYLMLGIL